MTETTPCPLGNVITIDDERIKNHLDRVRHIARTAWSTKRYLNIELLKDQQMRGAITV